MNVYLYNLVHKVHHGKFVFSENVECCQFQIYEINFIHGNDDDKAYCASDK